MSREAVSNKTSAGLEPNEIKQHLDLEREREIESGTQNVTNPRAYFEKNTGWILGAAVVGGCLLSFAARKSSNGHSALTPHGDSIAAPRGFPGSTHFQRVAETIDDIFEGLVNVVADKLQSFVAEVVPGFRERSKEAIERQQRWPSVRTNDLENEKLMPGSEVEILTKQYANGNNFLGKIIGAAPYAPDMYIVEYHPGLDNGHHSGNELIRIGKLNHDQFQNQTANPPTPPVHE